MEGDIVAKNDPGSKVKDKGLYEQLRGAGLSKKKSTKVANSAASTSRKKAAQRGGKAGSYDNWTVPDLQRRAKQVGIKNRSAMTKKQLVKALRTR
jgi:Rho termination factor, N-terminal domain